MRATATTTTKNTVRGNSIARIFIATALFLMIPLLAMQFTTEVNWTASDFVFAAALLIMLGLLYELIATKVHETRYRAVIATTLVAMVLVVWVELAVCIFD